MILELARDTLFLTLAGSRAHGTARPESDLDLRGVCVAPLSVRLALFSRFEQFEGALEGALWDRVRARLAGDPAHAGALAVKRETVIYDLGKFLSLCAAANPNALEILFADERDWLLDTPLWRRLYAERRRFLSKKVQQTYHGYALAQLKKIKSHRAWLLNPPAHKPARADFGLAETGTLSREDRNRIEQSIAEKIRSYGIDTLELPKAERIALEERLRSFWCDTLGTTEETVEDGLRAAAVSALALPKAVVGALEAERRYRAALKHWESYQRWRSERNPDRAVLERRFGYDTKHAMHLVRLMRTGLELLEHGTLSVRRPDAEGLRAIRDGALDYEALLAEAAALELRMAAAEEASDLPEGIDLGFVEALSLELIEAQALERST